MPDSFDAKVTLAHFGMAAKPEPKQAAPSARYHTVKEGESLWKIARQYKVKPEEIARLNGLEKDKIFPGMTLKVPD